MVKKINSGIIILIAALGIISIWFSVNSYQYVMELEKHNDKLLEQILIINSD
ncbi:MAG: hypothetical protein ULS35scaffold63_60 [Phage 33_17]|nr:MAG: hypothetical protein ULS35scaffold63_60 [Phage 33_17]